MKVHENYVYRPVARIVYLTSAGPDAHGLYQKEAFDLGLQYPQTNRDNGRNRKLTRMKLSL